MDAKSKANFINSVAGGQEIVCPQCGMANKAEGKYCVSCGKELSADSNAPAFAPAAAEGKEDVKKVSVKYIEPANAFAQGLPEWSVEPPQVMVRRRSV